jgi:hypothetical protein
MDLTIEVMLPPRGATDYTQSANERYRVLAPVAVYPLKTVATVGMQRTGYVHVTGVPERPAWANLTTEQLMAKLNGKLCAFWEDAQGNLVERRKWAGLASAIPANARNRLLNERQITVTWTAFKNVLQNLIEQRQLADGDLD